jgi:hypothetical protein
MVIGQGYVGEGDWLIVLYYLGNTGGGFRKSLISSFNKILPLPVSVKFGHGITVVLVIAYLDFWNQPLQSREIPS